VKYLQFVLAIAIVVALGCISYLVVTPSPSEKFTEFYILNAEGKAENYPQQVILGQPIDIVIGVVNHEYQSVSYRVGITIEGIENSQVDIGILSHGEKWEEKVSFVSFVASEKQRVEFYLYKDGGIVPYSNLYLSLIQLPLPQKR